MVVHRPGDYHIWAGMLWSTMIPDTVAPLRRLRGCRPRAGDGRRDRWEHGQHSGIIFMWPSITVVLLAEQADFIIPRLLGREARLCHGFDSAFRTRPPGKHPTVKTADTPVTTTSDAPILSGVTLGRKRESGHGGLVRFLFSHSVQSSRGPGS